MKPLVVVVHAQSLNAVHSSEVPFVDGACTLRDAVALFMYLYRYLDVNMSVWDVIMPTLIPGFRIRLLMAPVIAAAMNAVPARKAGLVSSLLTLVMQVGGSLGIALLATVLSHRVRFHLDVMGSAAQADLPAFREAFSRMVHHAVGLGYSHAEASQVATVLMAKNLGQAATVAGFQDAFLVGAVIVALAILPSLLLPGKPVGHRGPGSGPADLVE